MPPRRAEHSAPQGGHLIFHFILSVPLAAHLKYSLFMIHYSLSSYPAAVAFFLIAWVATYYVLVTWTNSTVPLLDSFTNALSFVGLWALARKYLEQWFFWIVVDAVCSYLYISKGIPFKATLYALYVLIAVMGYFKWKSMMKKP